MATREDPRELLAALAARESRSAQAGADRRNFPRHTVRGDAAMWRDGAGPSGNTSRAMLANVRDASRGGLGLVSADRLEAGAIYRVACASEGVEAFAAQVVVRHAQQIAGGAWVIGTAFVAEGAWLMSLGVPALDLRAEGLAAESLDDEGEFGGVAA